MQQEKNVTSNYEMGTNKRINYTVVMFMSALKVRVSYLIFA